jgi:Cu-Zn family superoxide dismutase
MALALVVSLGACQSAPEQAGPSAAAQLEPTRGNNTAGKITFTQLGDKVRVAGDVSGLRPNQEHGFHIHDAGDCSSGDGMSAKGHFNPYGKPHGNPSSPDHHAGDMLALRSDASGNARVDTSLDIISVTPGPASVIGRGLIVHADPDDYTTQPTGNSGARIACGVIGIAAGRDASGNAILIPKDL